MRGGKRFSTTITPQEIRETAAVFDKNCGKMKQIPSEFKISERFLPVLHPKGAFARIKERKQAELHLAAARHGAARPFLIFRGDASFKAQRRFRRCSEGKKTERKRKEKRRRKKPGHPDSLRCPGTSRRPEIKRF
jgi:hypothetical protein